MEHETSFGGKLFLTQLEGDDVLLGRGTGPNDFEGNIRFRQLVAEVARATHPIELTASKATLARRVVETVQRRGGRFVRKLAKSETAALMKSRAAASGKIDRTAAGASKRKLEKGQAVYVEVSIEVAVEKTKQSFRHQKRLTDTPRSYVEDAADASALVEARSRSNALLSHGGGDATSQQQQANQRDTDHSYIICRPAASTTIDHIGRLRSATAAVNDGDLVAQNTSSDRDARARARQGNIPSDLGGVPIDEHKAQGPEPNCTSLIEAVRSGSIPLQQPHITDPSPMLFPGHNSLLLHHPQAAEELAAQNQRPAPAFSPVYDHPYNPLSYPQTFSPSYNSDVSSLVLLKALLPQQQQGQPLQNTTGSHGGIPAGYEGIYRALAHDLTPFLYASAAAAGGAPPPPGGPTHRPFPSLGNYHRPSYQGSPNLQPIVADGLGSRYAQFSQQQQPAIPTYLTPPVPTQHLQLERAETLTPALLSAILASNIALASNLSGTLNAVSPALQQHLLLVMQQQQQQQLQQQRIYQQQSNPTIAAAVFPAPHESYSPPLVAPNINNNNHDSSPPQSFIGDRMGADGAGGRGVEAAVLPPIAATSSTGAQQQQVQDWLNFILSRSRQD